MCKGNGGGQAAASAILFSIPQQHQHQPVHRAGHGAGDRHLPGDGEHLHHRPCNQTLCRGYGREKIAASVQAIRDQENVERMQRRSRRRHEIEAR